MKKYYVLGFAFSSNWQHVLLVTKARPDWQKGLLNGLGGHVEDGETSLHAMHREFEEESGLGVCCWTKFAVMESSDFSVTCYWETTSLDFLNTAHTDSDEPVAAYYIEALRKYRKDDTVPNLFMLLEAAHAHATRNQPVLQIIFP